MLKNVKRKQHVSPGERRCEHSRGRSRPSQESGEASKVRHDEQAAHLEWYTLCAAQTGHHQYLVYGPKAGVKNDFSIAHTTPDSSSYMCLWLSSTVCCAGGRRKGTKTEIVEFSVGY